MSFLSYYKSLDSNYNLGTAVIQCTSVPGGAFPTGLITVPGTGYSSLCANHLAMNYKSIVTSGPNPNTGYFNLKAGTYKAFFTIQSFLQTTAGVETYAYYNVRIRRADTPAPEPVAKFVNSWLGANGPTVYRMVNGDYNQETLFTLSASTSTDPLIRLSHRNNSGTNLYTGYSQTQWASLTPYQVYAQLILQKLA